MLGVQYDLMPFWGLLYPSWGTTFCFKPLFHQEVGSCYGSCTCFLFDKTFLHVSSIASWALTCDCWQTSKHHGIWCSFNTHSCFKITNTSSTLHSPTLSGGLQQKSSGVWQSLASLVKVGSKSGQSTKMTGHDQTSLSGQSPMDSTRLWADFHQTPVDLIRLLVLYYITLIRFLS